MEGASTTRYLNEFMLVSFGRHQPLRAESWIQSDSGLLGSNYSDLSAFGMPLLELLPLQLGSLDCPHFWPVSCSK